MNIVTFLDKCPDIVYHNPVLCFTGASYPLLFFSQVANKLSTQGILIKKISPEQDASSLQAELSTAFLGNQLWYWLGDIGQLSAQKQKELVAFAHQYQGPHILSFYTNEQPQLPYDSIIVENEIDKKTFVHLLKYFHQNVQYNERFLKPLFQKHSTISLDIACLLMHYHEVLGTNVSRFMQYWLDEILVPEYSLFALATHFFAKQQKKFFLLWPELAPKYSPAFWTVFWSEQLFRAYGFVQYAKAKNYLEAKKISYRLPFSFMQRDWKKTSLVELQQAHDFVYHIDYGIKNGLSDIGFEVFYLKFFLGEFRPISPS